MAWTRCNGYLLAMRVAASGDLFFKGRLNDTRLGAWVTQAEEPPKEIQGKESIFIWGCPDDEGVRLNLGRVGAKAGPDGIRKYFYRMTPPMDFQWEKYLAVYDIGNLVPAGNILETQNRCNQLVAKWHSSLGTLICLGGGHDFAAPNFLGFAANRHSVGLLNVDPHLDVRELDNGPHSGTPFRQILESGDLHPSHFIQFGTRTNRNSRVHYEYCVQKGVKIVPFNLLRDPGADFSDALERLSKRVDTVAVTFDLDCCRDTEGTSAAPVVGFSTRDLYEMARIAGEKVNVKYFELAEVAPTLEKSERSARIAAEILYAFLLSRACSLAKNSRKSKKKNKKRQ